MHRDVAYEAFLFSIRHTLDAVQLVSRALRDTVGQSTTLPLRYIGRAWLNECGNHHFISGLTEGDMVANGDGILHVPMHYPTFSTEAGKWDCLRRLNNAFVEKLVVCLACGTFLPYLREHSEDFFCRLSMLSTDCVSRHTVAIQHDLAAFVVQKFSPKAYEPQADWDRGLLAQHITLFDHESFRHSIERLELDCLEFVEIPTSVLPVLFSVSKLEECNIQCVFDPTAWINGFLQTFEQAEGELRMVRSVTVVLNEGYADDWRPNNVAHAPPRLVLPRQTGLPPPRTAFVDTLLADEVESRTQTKSELYVFTNALLAKQLNVYKWRIDEEEEGRTYHHEVTHIVLIDM